MLTSVAVRAEGEYRELRAELTKAFSGERRPAVATGLCDGAADALLAALLGDFHDKGPALILLPEEKECVRLQNLLAAFGVRAAFFTARDLTFYNITASHEYEHDRLGVLWGLLGGHYDAVLTTPDAALGFTVSRERLQKATLTINRDSVMEPAELAEKLVAAGYARVELVEGPGQFAVRGGIVDIYAPNLRALTPDNRLITDPVPVRIEFFGDEVDRIGLFDEGSQRVHTMVAGVELPPAREVLLTDESRAALTAVVRERLQKCKDERAAEELRTELLALEAQAEIRFADKYLTLIDPEKETLLSYFGERTFCVVRGTNAIRDRLKAATWHWQEQVKELLENDTISPRFAEYGLPAAALDAFLDSAVTLHVDSIAEGVSGKRLSGLFDFRTKHTVAYGDRTELLTEDLQNYLRADYRVILAAENEMSAKNMAGYLKENGYDVTLADDDDELPPAGRITVTWREPTVGFELPTVRAAVLSLAVSEVTGGLVPGQLRRAGKKRDAKQEILNYADLRPGDLVVHEAHGIGRYTGLETLTIDGVTRDYVGIQYAGSDKLFLPCDRLDALSKYIGAHADDGMVKLSRFGGGDWKKAKQRAKAAARDMAKDLIRLYAERERRPGFAFPADDDYQLDFEAAFPYRETAGQATAAEEIKADMTRPVPMDRLLCGDVGFGKTEVALRAAFKAVLAGKQVAMLVPTTILALQHFGTVQARMRAFGVRVDMLSRFRTPKQQAATLLRLARGDVDMVIGTHRLVSKDVRFKDLGLLIVDEEQRFGVAQKEKLKQLTGNVDVLTLTATPIPRTLNMAMSGIRDISILDEAPGDRLPVQTYVLEDDDVIIHDAIRRELRRGGQVFYLHNVVETIHETAVALARAIPEARITVAHGQMDKAGLERIWGDMIAGKIDILVSTTIIETGVDVPNANTLIVDNAHRLGLSQLHQIRGRVGRSPRRAYAYFTYPRGRALGDIQRKRLEAIREYAEFGAGFRIALRDLELRGAGNLLGSEQHGHLDAVGYDLYVKLLNEAVLEEKGQTVREKTECLVSLAFDACLPERYVHTAGERIALYKRISLIGSTADLDDMKDELADRYGALPRPAENLLHIALIRAMAEQCNINSIRQQGDEISLYSPDFDTAIWMALSKEYPGQLRMMMSGSPYIRFKPRGNALTATEALLTRLLAETTKKG